MRRLALIILMIASASLFAQNFNDALRLSEEGLGSNARALGMGNAYHAVSDDFSAVFFNPAGLGLVKRMEIAGSFDYNNFSNKAKFFTGTTEASEDAVAIGQFGLIAPMPTVRGSIVLGFGYTRDRTYNRISKFDGFNGNGTSYIQNLTDLGNPLPWDLYLNDLVAGSDNLYETRVNGNLNQSGDIVQDGYTSKWAFTGSTEIARGLFAGISLNLLSGDFKSDRRYYETDTRDVYKDNLELVAGDPSTADFMEFHVNDIIEWELSGYDFKLGLLYNHFDKYRIGFSIKTPSKFTVKEKYFLDGYSDFATAKYNLNDITDEAEYDISTPYEFTAAGAVNIFPVILSGEITYIDYSTMEFTGGLGGGNELSWRNREIKDLMSSVLNLRGGVEFNIAPMDTRIRGGFIYMPSAFDGDPSEYNKKYVTFGLGFVPSEFFAVDAAYAYGWWESITDNYGNPGDSRISESITTGKFVVSLLYRY